MPREKRLAQVEILITSLGPSRLPQSRVPCLELNLGLLGNLRARFFLLTREAFGLLLETRLAYEPVATRVFSEPKL